MTQQEAAVIQHVIDELCSKDAAIVSAQRLGRRAYPCFKPEIDALNALIHKEKHNADA